MGHFDKGTLPKSRQSVESCSSAGDDFPTHSISTKLINGHFSQSKILRFAKLIFVHLKSALKAVSDSQDFGKHNYSGKYEIANWWCNKKI